MWLYYVCKKYFKTRRSGDKDVTRVIKTVNKWTLLENIVILFFFCGEVLGFEFRVLHLLGRLSTTWVMPQSCIIISSAHVPNRRLEFYLSTWIYWHFSILLNIYHFQLYMNFDNRLYVRHKINIKYKKIKFI
jgi:hypothetical protein